VCSPCAPFCADSWSLWEITQHCIDILDGVGNHFLVSVRMWPLQEPTITKNSKDGSSILHGARRPPGRDSDGDEGFLK
jgi:hypothetical protein